MARKLDVPGVALITGAASGIGRATALSFVQGGCTKLALLDLNEAGLATTKELLEKAISSAGGTPEIGTYKCDVSSPESVASAYAGVKASFPRIDYAVHCAGIIVFAGASVDLSVDDFDRQNSINYRGLWLCSREAIKIMRTQALDSEAYPDNHISPVRAQRGAIVNISSGLAVYAQPNCPAYCGAKAGVLALTRCDALDYVADRIRVNAVLPGIVDSPMTNPNPEVRAWLEANPVQHSPMKRFGEPEEIADVAVFLASNKASLVTGASWSVDGGSLAGYT
ncbi:hypothetical protein A1O3_02223 [Capronia epimyces CBS 606.96]|uniref:Ketoreductase domain-containing protein n=1 Tax=Capronia epimyces CBS 606.96 TaxID=1182542 RepID=W9Z3S2_9EURO|nr:uncharacterized protein A1O3_02223 [Capronia epimyces CBS 606.96]EXJ89159.1 hypothetical protein A1O3_02223 [Capronia epimyces CBS 606.96]